MSRRTITIPDDWWNEFAAEAERKGENVSEFLREAGRRRLPKDAQARLSVPKGRGNYSKVKPE